MWTWDFEVMLLEYSEVTLSSHWKAMSESMAKMKRMMMCWTALSCLNSPLQIGKLTLMHCCLKLEQFVVSFESRLGGSVAGEWSSVTNGATDVADDGECDGTSCDTSRSQARRQEGCISIALLDSFPWCCHLTRVESTCNCHDPDRAASRAADVVNMMPSSCF